MLQVAGRPDRSHPLSSGLPAGDWPGPVAADPTRNASLTLALPSSGISNLVTSGPCPSVDISSLAVFTQRALWKFKQEQNICIALNYPSLNILQL